MSSAENKIKYLLKKYGKSSDNYLVNIKLAYLYLQLGKTANAEYFYKRSLILNNDSIEAKLGLYCTCVAAGDYRSGQTYLLDVVRADPLNYYGNLYLAYSYMGRKEYSSASKVVKKMLHYYPSDQTFLNLLQTNYQNQKKRRSARKIQKQLAILKK